MLVEPEEWIFENDEPEWGDLERKETPTEVGASANRERSVYLSLRR